MQIKRNGDVDDADADTDDDDIHVGAVPLAVLPGNPTLSREALVKIRRAHQPRHTARAVRQLTSISLSGLVQPLRLRTQATPRARVKEPSIHDKILPLVSARDSALAPVVATSTTSGVNRIVRHTGVFADPLSGASQGARAVHTSIVLDTVAQVR